MSRSYSRVAKRNSTVMAINHTQNFVTVKSRLSFLPGDPITLSMAKSGSIYETNYRSNYE